MQVGLPIEFYRAVVPNTPQGFLTPTPKGRAAFFSRSLSQNLDEDNEEDEKDESLLSSIYEGDVLQKLEMEEELDEKKRKQNELYDQLVQQVFGSEQGP